MILLRDSARERLAPQEDRVKQSIGVAVVLALVGVVAAAAAARPPAQPPRQAPARAASADDKTAADVERVERELVAAISKADLATYDRIVADDYVAYSDNGATLTKPEIMASYRTGTRKYLALAVSDVSVRVFGDTAIFSGNTSGTRIENGGKPVPNRVRYFRVFVRRQGQWRAVMQIVQALPAPTATK
jgi:ketosteroid isomerase-like protein